MKKHKAYLIKEKKIVYVDSIHWNKGYGGALEVYVDNPEFDFVRDVIDINMGIPDTEEVFTKEPFFTYINHVLDAHLKETPHEFILLRPPEIQDKNDIELYEGDLVKYFYYPKKEYTIGEIKYLAGSWFLKGEMTSSFTTLFEGNLPVWPPCLPHQLWEKVGSIHDKK